MIRRIAAAALIASAAVPAFADDFNLDPAAAQATFDHVARDVIATINYKAMGPAEATGLSGFSIGLVGTYTPVDKDDWKAVTGSDLSGIGMAGIQVTKGLPLHFDVGGFFTAVPGTSAKIWGAELRYAILPGSTTLPALAVRGAYSRTAGVDDFSAESKSVDVSVSKGFAILTPYLGIGQVWGRVNPDRSIPLDEKKESTTRFFAGLRLGLGVFDVVPEFEKIGGNEVYNLKLGFSI